jgi:hypothetical protein
LMAIRIKGQHIKATTILAAVGALFVVYFPIALWLKYSYAPPRGPPGAIWKLIYFRKYDDSGVAFISYDKKLREIGDTEEAPERSPVILYEDGKPLGPAHRLHDEINKFGQGRFSHWAVTGGLFSRPVTTRTRERTDENTGPSSPSPRPPDAPCSRRVCNCFVPDST